MLKKIFIISSVILFSQTALADTENGISPDSVNLLDRFDQIFERLGSPVSFDEDKTQLEFDGEFRYRLEYRDDFNFNDKI